MNTPLRRKHALSAGARVMLGLLLGSMLGLLLGSMLVLLLCAVAVTARADTWVNAGFLSMHSKPGYNNTNTGWGVEHDINEWVAVTAGTYRNSDGYPSRYAALALTTEVGMGVRAGVTLGGVDGYPISRDVCWQLDQVCPREPEFRDIDLLVLPVLSVEHGFAGANLVLVPAMGVSGAAAVAVQFKLKIR